MKLGLWNGVEMSAMPEYEDCRKAAGRRSSEAVDAGGGGCDGRSQGAGMTKETIFSLLKDVQRGGISPEKALRRLADLPFEDAEFAKIDHHRTLRLGLPEVIFAEGKTRAQVAEIFLRMANSGSDVLATRADRGRFAAVRKVVPEAQYHAEARIITLRQEIRNEKCGPVAVICAGTSDLPVAEEAAVTAEFLGTRVERVYDVGVAGLHRLLTQRETLQQGQ